MAVNDLVLVFFSTIIIKFAVAWLFRLRVWYSQTAVVLINFITSPLLFFSLWLIMTWVLRNGFFYPYSYDPYATENEFKLIVATIVGVVIVIFIDWGLLVYALKGSSKKLFVPSVVMNIASFIIGIGLLALSTY